MFNLSKKYIPIPKLKILLKTINYIFIFKMLNNIYIKDIVKNKFIENIKLNKLFSFKIYKKK